MDKNERNKLLIGIGIGAAAGVGTGFLIGRNSAKKKYEKELKKVRRKAYLEGVEQGKDEGLTEAKAWIDTYCVVSDENETPEELVKRVQERQKELSEQETSDAEKEEKSAPVQEQEQNEMPLAPSEPIRIGMATYDTMNHQVVFSGVGGMKIAYPAGLFIGSDGEVLDSVDIRANIRKHEHNKARLNLIWNQMGWGAYVPDLDDDPIPDPSKEEITDEEINNWDLSLDNDDEPEEKIIEKERYMDEIDRYTANPEEAPRLISRKEFSEEAYLEKTYVDFYENDKVFVESTDGDRELDAYTYFGITDGNDLFRMKNDDEDDDPDIVHVKNFKMNCVMEVTRWHKSYASVKDGGAYIQDGSTD